MGRVRWKWWQALIAVAVLAAVIFALAPSYTDAQVAGTPAAFRAAVADAGDTRTALAGAADMVFVAAYLAVALSLTRPNVVSGSGLGVMCIAGVADVLENATVIRGVAMGDDVTQGTVDLIRRLGTVKWTGVVVGSLVILAGLLLDRRRVTSSDA